MYNQRLHYSLFNLPDRNAARRHFRKLNRRSRPAISNFVAASQGLGDRVDLTLMHLKVVPSIFWARVVAPFGLLRVNGVLIKDPAHRLKPADTLHLEWDRIARFQHFFEPNLRRREAYQRRTRRSTSSYPTNFEYHRGTRTLVYKHAPDEADLRKSSRLRANYFRWFKLDSV
jgi:ribosomal protein S4